jgi:hypothetical protein
MAMTLEEFAASAKPASDELAAMLVEYGHEMPRESVIEYAEHNMIHKADGKFYVHAWWYAPIGYATQAEAEQNLYAWYKELL